MKVEYKKAVVPGAAVAAAVIPELVGPEEPALNKCLRMFSALSQHDKLLFTKSISGVKSATKKAVNVGVGDFVTGLIFEGLSNKEILEKVAEKYGNDNTTVGCVAWYRNNLSKKGLL